MNEVAVDVVCGMVIKDDLLIGVPIIFIQR